MLRPSAAIAAMTAACVVGAGCGHHWPTTAPAKADPAFVARERPITTIDVLPIDVEAWTRPGSRRSPDEVRMEAEADLLGAASDELLARGYILDTAIGWDGQFVGPDGQSAVALDRGALLATLDSLSSYGLAAQRSAGLPVPFLPARLGAATHADATLYIGGWTFAGDDRSTGDKIAKGILIGVAIVGIIVVVAALAKHGGGGLGKLGGSVARGAARAATSAGRVALRAASAVIRAGNVAVHVVDDAARVAGDVLDTALDVADAFGHTSTHITLVSAPRQTWSERPGVPRSGHSRTYLELTLVDNRTGLALWHARQEFPSHAAAPQKAHRILRALMASLPTAGADPMSE